MCHRWRLHLPRLRWRRWLHLSLWRRRDLWRGLHLSLQGRRRLRRWLHLPQLRWRRSRRHLRRNRPHNVGLRRRSARRRPLAMLLPQRRGIGRRRGVWQSCRRHLAGRWRPLGRRLLNRWRLTLRCGRRRWRNWLLKIRCSLRPSCVVTDPSSKWRNISASVIPRSKTVSTRSEVSCHLWKSKKDWKRIHPRRGNLAARYWINSRVENSRSRRRSNSSKISEEPHDRRTTSDTRDVIAR